MKGQCHATNYNTPLFSLSLPLPLPSPPRMKLDVGKVLQAGLLDDVS